MKVSTLCASKSCILLVNKNQKHLDEIIFLSPSVRSLSCQVIYKCFSHRFSHIISTSTILSVIRGDRADLIINIGIRWEFECPYKSMLVIALRSIAHWCNCSSYPCRSTLFNVLITWISRKFNHLPLSEICHFLHFSPWNDFYSTLFECSINILNRGLRFFFLEYRHRGKGGSLQGFPISHSFKCDLAPASLRVLDFLYFKLSLPGPG